MLLCNWLRRPSRRRAKNTPKPPPVVARQVEEVPKLQETEVLSIVAIDQKNVYMPGLRTAWQLLRSEIDFVTQNTTQVENGRAAFRVVRVRNDSDVEYEKRAREAWESCGYVYQSHAEKDIDHIITHFIWDHVSKIMENKLKARIRLVLVSGDSDYVPVIESVRRNYAKRLQFELIVFSWEEKLSSRLIQVAGPGNVHFLDNIEGFTTDLSHAAK